MAQEQDLFRACPWLWQGVGRSSAQLTKVNGAWLPLEQPVQLPFGLLSWQHMGLPAKTCSGDTWHPDKALLGWNRAGGEAMAQIPARNTGHRGQ